MPLSGVYNYPRPTGVRPVRKRANVGQMGHRREPYLQAGNINFQEPDLCRKISQPRLPSEQTQNATFRTTCVFSLILRVKVQNTFAWKPKSSTIKRFFSSASKKRWKAAQNVDVRLRTTRKIINRAVTKSPHNYWIYLEKSSTNLSSESAIFSNSEFCNSIYLIFSRF